MLRHLRVYILAGAVVAIVETRTFGSEPPSFTEAVKPVLEKFCYNCHGQEQQKAGLSLHEFKSEGDAVKHPEVWKKVLANVRTREMPPSNKPQPTDGERGQITEWIERRLLVSDCSKPDPGRVTIRRLNRSEYNNTIRDLFGIHDFQPADDFPADDTGYGFDNIGDVLSVPPVLLEKYLAAAEKAIHQAILTDPHTNGPTFRVPANLLVADGQVQATKNGGLKMMREGALSTNLYFAGESDYVISIRTWGDQAGDEPPKLQVALDGKPVGTFEVKARERRSQTIKHKLRGVSAGEHQLSLAYINNYRNLDDPNPETNDRNLAVEFVDITGPSGPPEFPESHKRIFAVPASVGDDDARARYILERFVTRAYRRPATAREVDRLLNFYRVARQDGEKFEGAVSVALQATLVSPHFLFRGEVQQQPDNPDTVVPVDEFALASRLSYFLWSSMPDDELLALAAKNSLRKRLAGQVKRMMRDPKADAFVQNFVGQWLQLRNLELMQPDATVFPTFDEELRSAMRRETELLFTHLMREDRSLLELLNADYTFINERLAEHYEVKKVQGEEFRKVKLRDSGRGGVLTHASVLTLTSNPTRTSPVKRGKWVLENILGTPPPPPPPDVPELPEAKGQLQGTLRQRMEQHRDNPNCVSCHARMDPIGFGLENFDGIGIWRDTEGGQPVDAAGELITGEKFKNAVELKKLLVKYKREEFVRCVSEKMLTYALGRGLEFYDSCAVDGICRGVARRGHKFSALILEIVNSVPFQKRRGESAESE